MRAKEFTNKKVDELAPAAGLAARATLGAATKSMASNVAKGAATVAKNFAKGAAKTGLGFDADQDSLGGALAGAMGLQGTASELQTQKNQDMFNKGSQPTAKPGQDIDIPGIGPVKINRIGPGGVELDTSKTQLGVPKISINPRDLKR
jgi:hypothetical protein